MTVTIKNGFIVSIADPRGGVDTGRVAVAGTEVRRLFGFDGALRVVTPKIT